MIFDTSIWIEYTKGQVNPKSSLLREHFGNNVPIHICPCIVQEVLQGCTSVNQFLFIRELISGLTLLQSNEYEMSIKAAQMYFQLRKNGITIRKPNDCLIAIYALEYNLSLIHNDKDFDQIAQLFPLRNNEY